MTRDAPSYSDKKWRKGVFCQIYPSNFKDSNGDGMGDIPGIISKLDYIKALDIGYDILNYKDVYKPYRTVNDVEDLIVGCHERGIKIIFDLVTNHTSIFTSGFKESSPSITNPKRDWYIWRPRRFINGERHRPSNWRSFFCGSAWEWDEASGKYYVHYFVKEQADHNWQNPERLGFPDAPIVDNNSPWQPASEMFKGPRMPKFVIEINEKVFSHYDCMTVGELFNTPDSNDLSYVSAEAKHNGEVFLMDLVTLGPVIDKFAPRKWELSKFKYFLQKRQCFIEENDGWTANYLENHGTARSVSRFGSDNPKFRENTAKMLAILLATLTGTTYVCQGQELEITNAPKDWPIEEYKDIESLNYYKDIKKSTNNDPVTLNKALNGIQLIEHDHDRLPVY